jgi:hypothetical protein
MIGALLHPNDSPRDSTKERDSLRFMELTGWN